MTAMRDVFLFGCFALAMAGGSICTGQTAAGPKGSSQEISQSSDAGPESPLSLEQLRGLIDHGQSDQALKLLDSLGLREPATPGVAKLRGLALYSQEHFAAADKAFNNALTQNPLDQEAMQMRGLTLFRLGKPTEAIPFLEAAHEWTAQTKVDPSYVLALCYLDTRKYDSARHAFATQYGFPPDSAAAYLLAARMLLRREYVPVAQEYARKALELNPELPLAHGLLGEVALAQEHLDDAIAEFEQERARNPLYGGVYDRLGDAYSRAGKYTMAQQTLQQALLLEPNSTGPYILLGKVMLKERNPVGAAAYLERAVKMDGANFMSHSLLGQAYRAMGRLEDASRETSVAQKIQAANEPKLEAIH